MEKLQNVIARNFRVLLAERGLKVSHVYEATGISRTTLTFLANGKNTGIQFSTLEKICQFLKVPVTELFKQKEPTSVAPEEGHE